MSISSTLFVLTFPEHVHGKKKCENFWRERNDTTSTYTNDIFSVALTFFPSRRLGSIISEALRVQLPVHPFLSPLIFPRVAPKESAGNYINIILQRHLITSFKNDAIASPAKKQNHLWRILKRIRSGFVSVMEVDVEISQKQSSTRKVWTSSAKVSLDHFLWCYIAMSLFACFVIT